MIYDPLKHVGSFYGNLLLHCILALLNGLLLRESYGTIATEAKSNIFLNGKGFLLPD